MLALDKTNELYNLEKEDKSTTESKQGASKLIKGTKTWTSSRETGGKRKAKNRICVLLQKIHQTIIF